MFLSIFITHTCQSPNWRQNGWCQNRSASNCAM